jgi:MoxR-like ATPase
VQRRADEAVEIGGVYGAAIGEGCMDTPLTWLPDIRSELAKVIVGQQDLIEGVLLGLLCNGHVLMEGNPGLAKTLLAKTLGQILSLTFTRLQCTPDLTPTDILGTSDAHGPVFTNILLADEINRAQPRTQSALLEAMEERQVTLSGQTTRLPTPFLVLATQNPIEMEGTFPLPEAQLDRFLLKLLVTYPGREALRDILTRTTLAMRPDVQIIGHADDLTTLQREVRERMIPARVQDYIARLILATHPDQAFAVPLVRRYVLYGASPRGAQSLALGGKAMALMDGREVVTIVDVQAVAVRSLQHRLMLNFEGVASGIVAGDILRQVLALTPEGVEEGAA